MSFQAICWAFNQKLESSSEKFVLVCLANYANESFEAYPSIKTLSDLTSLDRKTVIAGLDKLEQSKLISDTGKRVGLTKSVKVYQLSSPKTGTSPEKGIPFFRGSSPVFPSKQSQKRYIDPIREPVREPGEGKSPPNPLRGPKKTVNEIDSQLRDLDEDMKALKSKGGHESPTGFVWTEQPILEEWKTLNTRKKELRKEKMER